MGGGENTGDDVHGSASTTVGSKMFHGQHTVAQYQQKMITVAASKAVVSGKLYVSKHNFKVRNVNVLNFSDLSAKYSL